MERTIVGITQGQYAFIEKRHDQKLSDLAIKLKDLITATETKDQAHDLEMVKASARMGGSTADAVRKFRFNCRKALGELQTTGFLTWWDIRPDGRRGVEKMMVTRNLLPI